MSGLAKTPAPPYYAVIFSSERTEGDLGYQGMADRMLKLASIQEGFLGVESASNDNLGITVSYWESLDSIKKWKGNAEHQVAQDRGKSVWYKGFVLRVCKVEREKYFEI